MMVWEVLWKLRVANTVVGFGGGGGVGARSSDAAEVERWRRCRLEAGWGWEWRVPLRLRVTRPPDCCSAGVSWSSARPAGVEGSSLTLPLLPGRSSDAGTAPVAVLTDWLRVMRPASSAAEETTL